MMPVAAEDHPNFTVLFSGCVLVLGHAPALNPFTNPAADCSSCPNHVRLVGCARGATIMCLTFGLDPGMQCFMIPLTVQEWDSDGEWWCQQSCPHLGRCNSHTHFHPACEQTHACLTPECQGEACLWAPIS